MKNVIIYSYNQFQEIINRYRLVGEIGTDDYIYDPDSKSFKDEEVIIWSIYPPDNLKEIYITCFGYYPTTYTYTVEDKVPPKPSKKGGRTPCDKRKCKTKKNGTEEIFADDNKGLPHVYVDRDNEQYQSLAEVPQNADKIIEIEGREIKAEFSRCDIDTFYIVSPNENGEKEALLIYKEYGAEPMMWDRLTKTWRPLPGWLMQDTKDGDFTKSFRQIVLERICSGVLDRQRMPFNEIPGAVNAGETTQYSKSDADYPEEEYRFNDDEEELADRLEEMGCTLLKNRVPSADASYSIADENNNIFAYGMNYEAVLGWIED